MKICPLLSTGLCMALLLLGSSCEKEAVVSLPPYTPKLVVEGWIEQQQHPTVILTKSAHYFDRVDSASIRKLVMSTAKVTVSDGEQEEILTLRRKSNDFPHFIYQGTSIRGEIGKTYYLTVETEEGSYTASTTIPAPVSLDSLWFEALPGNDSLGYVWATFTDDPQQDNYYRLFTRRKGKDKDFVPVYLSALGDQFFNGKTLDFTLLQGAKGYSEEFSEEFSEGISGSNDSPYFQRGDSIHVKLCAIDQPHFEFWRSLEKELSASQNPLSASGNSVLGNIEGGALGVWGGYGVSHHFMVAQ